MSKIYIKEFNKCVECPSLNGLFLGSYHCSFDANNMRLENIYEIPDKCPLQDINTGTDSVNVMFP